MPLPDGRRPTDWERSTAGLQDARWATADMAFARGALEAVGGFDERFPRAYRRTPTWRRGSAPRAAGWSRGSGTSRIPSGPPTGG